MKQQHKIAFGAILGIWTLLLFTSVLPPGDSSSPENLISPFMKSAVAAKGKGGGYFLKQTYQTADTSIDSTTIGLEKGNQSKLFFYDSTWWMVAKMAISPVTWAMWRFDSSRTWTSVFSDPNAQQKDAPDLYLERSTGTLYIFFSGRSGASGISSLNKLAYNSGSRTWSPIAPTVTVPVIKSGSADSPANFLKAKNGDLWAFSTLDSILVAVMSKDDGATWSDTIAIGDTLNTGSALTDAVCFTSNSGINYIALGVAENNTSSSVRNKFFIHQEGTDSTVWIEESANVGSLGAEAADDHLAMTVDSSNRVYMFTKTSGGGALAPENVLYVRYPDSSWTSHVVIETSTEGGDQWTRPTLIIDMTNDSLYLFGTLAAGDSTIGRPMEYKRAPLGDYSGLQTFAPVRVMQNGNNTFWNTSVAQHDVHDSTELMVLADNLSQGNIWFNRLGIGPTFPAIPTYIDSTIRGFDISKSGSDIVLEWRKCAEVDSYVVYRGTLPFFSADTARLAVLSTADDTTYTDVGAANLPGTQYYYMARAYIGGSPGPLSMRLGKFELELLRGTSSGFNFIGLALADSAITMASDIEARIGSTVELVSRYNWATQTFISYNPALPFTDFAVEFNGSYFVSVTANDTICLLGQIPTGHVFTLDTTSTSDYNTIMHLMDMDTLTMASEIVDDMGGSSVVELLARYNASTQTYISYNPLLPFTDFAVFPGQALFTSMKDSLSWPTR